MNSPSSSRSSPRNIAAGAQFLRDGSHHGPRIAHVNNHDIIDCFACGFRHVLPLPDAATLEEEYRRNYYANEKPTFIAHANEDQAWFALAQTDRLESIERHLEPTRRRLLDVGCGPGFFLKTAIARGWHGHGVEPSALACAHARGLGADVTEGFFNNETAQELGRFDAVNLTNVLEHVPDPITIVERATCLLKPGGVLCVGVPNDFSPFQIAAKNTLGIGAWWIAPPHHLNYFDFESLAALLTRLGLCEVERTTSFPMEAFLMMGINYTPDPALGRACHDQRKRFDFALENAGMGETRRNFYRGLAAQGIGREAVIVAIRA